jgi:hypothetical protein
VLIEITFGTMASDCARRGDNGTLSVAADVVIVVVIIVVVVVVVDDDVVCSIGTAGTTSGFMTVSVTRFLPARVSPPSPAADPPVDDDDNDDDVPSLSLVPANDDVLGGAASTEATAAAAAAAAVRLSELLPLRPDCDAPRFKLVDVSVVGAPRGDGGSRATLCVCARVHDDAAHSRKPTHRCGERCTLAPDALSGGAPMSLIGDRTQPLLTPSAAEGAVDAAPDVTAGDTVLAALSAAAVLLVLPSLSSRAAERRRSMFDICRANALRTAVRGLTSSSSSLRRARRAHYHTRAHIHTRTRTLLDRCAHVGHVVPPLRVP